MRQPVVVEAKEGLTSAEALALWPISRTIAVLLSRDDDKRRKPPRRVRGGLASHANKLVASKADRFVFSPKPAEWLPTWCRRGPTCGSQIGTDERRIGDTVQPSKRRPTAPSPTRRRRL